MGAISIPSYKKEIPKVSLILPDIMSVPTVLRRRPKIAMIEAFKTERLLRYITKVIPIKIIEKYSGGPNRIANLDKGRASRESAMILNVPPMKEPRADIPKAGPARPFLAIWCPSKQVTTEAASPGILTSIEVVEPPYIAP
jgi:hypothetical protein